MELQIIQNKIFAVRGTKVILDFHLAELYQVETRVLKQAVKRNLERFPEDFMFQLTQDEFGNVFREGVSQFVIPPGYNVGTSTPFAFTEQGVAMLSSVLRSPRAVEINIAIMRAFVTMRQMAYGYEDLRRRIENLELGSEEMTKVLEGLLDQKQLPTKKRKPIGYLSHKYENQ